MDFINRKIFKLQTVALEGSSLDKINKDCISRGLLNVTNNTGLLGPMAGIESRTYGLLLMLLIPLKDFDML